MLVLLYWTALLTKLPQADATNPFARLDIDDYGDFFQVSHVFCHVWLIIIQDFSCFGTLVSSVLTHSRRLAASETRSSPLFIPRFAILIHDWISRGSTLRVPLWSRALRLVSHQLCGAAKLDISDCYSLSLRYSDSRLSTILSLDRLVFNLLGCFESLSTRSSDKWWCNNLRKKKTMVVGEKIALHPGTSDAALPLLGSALIPRHFWLRVLSLVQLLCAYVTICSRGTRPYIWYPSAGSIVLQCAL